MVLRLGDLVEGLQLRREKCLHNRSGPQLLHMVRFAATRFARDLAGWLRRGALDLAGTVPAALSRTSVLRKRESSQSGVLDRRLQWESLSSSRLLKKAVSTACALTLVSPEAGEKIRNGEPAT